MDRPITPIVLAAAVAAATLPTAAPAQVLATGTYAAGDSVFRDGSVALGPGRYRFTLSLSAPALVDGSVTNSRNTNFFCDFQDGGGVVPCGGDDVPIDTLLAPINPTLYQANVTVAPPSTFLTPGEQTVRTENFDLCCTYRFGFDASGAGGYGFSVSALPEPAAWAVMLAGFAGTGAMVRRRRARVALG